jgi:hypothetical protein
MLKPALLAVLLAFVPGGPDSVTLNVDRRLVTFGDPVRLSGIVAPRAEPVTVFALPYDGGTYPAETVPDRAGQWELFAVPLVTTQYRARVDDVDSAETPVVAVRPRVHLVVISARRGVFHTRAEARFSYEGRSARLERLTRRGWRIVRSVRLGARSAVRFAATLPRGVSRVRVAVDPIPGYARGISRVARIRR